MAQRNVEEYINSLNRLRDGSPEAVSALRKALSDRVNLVVAKAAKIAAETQRHELLPDLLKAFTRLFEKPVQSDPQCWGKNALAKALVDLGYDRSEPYLRGASHIQMEPVFGGQEDSAPTLRGTCLLALASCIDIGRETILQALVNAVTEENSAVRADAVTALAQMGGNDSALLLRLKARAGDREPSITGTALEALLRLEGAGAVGFVADFLGRSDLREEAALALGASRLASAVERLKAAWEGTREGGFREVVLRAMSAARVPEAIEFLLHQVRAGRARDAQDALEALELHKESPEIVRQIRDAVSGRTDLLPRARQLFG